MHGIRQEATHIEKLCTNLHPHPQISNVGCMPTMTYGFLVHYVLTCFSSNNKLHLSYDVCCSVIAHLPL
jgi:hypothetical protein